MFSLLSPKNEALSWRRPAIVGYAVIIVTFVVMGTWSAYAQLDEAVTAIGTVANESSVKSIEHLESGIVREVRVKEGQHVKQNDVLIRLSPLRAQASSDLVRNQLDAAIVLEARLSAELDDRSEITLPSDIEKRRRISPELDQMVKDEQNQFRERRASLDAEVALYKSKISQLKIETGGIGVEKSATEKQVSYVDEELVGLRKLREDNLIPISRALAMERERSRLEGVVGQASTDITEANNKIAEANLEITQLEQKFREQVSAELLDTRQKIDDLREKASVMNDVLSRQDILAPKSGTIQNLRVSGVGQVIGSGEVLMEIVPDDEKLVVHVQLPTTEIEHVHEGMTIEIRFPTFHSRRIPLMLGTLDSVSRDRLIDQATKRPYYLGIVSVAKATIPKRYRDKIIAGMPAEAIIATGERTALSYVMSPLLESLRRSFRE